MGASSVTGVGQGSADKSGQKGSEHLFVGVEKLIGTRIVLSGYANLVSGTSVTVDLPQNLPGVWSGTFDGTSSASDYVVIIGAYNDTTNRYSVTSMTTTANVQNFVITCSASVTKTVFWEIVRITAASVSGYPTHN